MESFLVIGMGRFGCSLAVELSNLGHDVLVIDKNEEKIEAVADRVTHAVIGDARDENVIRSLGARNFDVAVVAIADNVEDSVLITIMLKELGVKKVVAKAQSLLHMKVLQRIGADETVLPERDMGKRLAQHLSSKNIIDFIELSDDHSIVELEAPADWYGKSLAELNIRAVFGINIIAARDKTGKNLCVSPGATYVIKEGEILIVIGENGDIKRLRGEK
ncbi:MAG: TrkA family potassium uptake protein [Oscillospiraceae bacterium]|nr:TrkA family potassium uptake protein [Oscillospiraceae bacterium]